MKQSGYTEPFTLVEQEENGSLMKKFILLIALFLVGAIGWYTAFNLNALAPTYNGDVDVAALSKNPYEYTLEEADGAAYVIVAENLAKTEAQNVCFSVVFNFRGYDTMGESFILIAALAGSLCILREPKHGKKAKKGKEEKANG